MGECGATAPGNIKNTQKGFFFLFDALIRPSATFSHPSDGRRNSGFLLFFELASRFRGNDAGLLTKHAVAHAGGVAAGDNARERGDIGSIGRGVA